MHEVVERVNPESKENNSKENGQHGTQRGEAPCGHDLA